MDVVVHDYSQDVRNALETVRAAILEELGLVAEGYAKRLCPVDTGRLRNSISHASDGENAYIGTNVEYAVYVELGTVRTRAQPYLKPALTDHSSEYQEIIKRGLSTS